MHPPADRPRLGIGAVRRWLRIPPPPVPRQPCDCAALAQQNAEMRARLELLAAVYQAADDWVTAMVAEAAPALHAAMQRAQESLEAAVRAVREADRG